MKRPLSHNDALWAIITQLLALIIFSPWVWIFWCAQPAQSFVIGGLICILPNIYLYRRVFAYSGAQALRIVKALYWGEAVKIILTAGFFASALPQQWILPLWLFVGYLVAQGGFWLGPIFLALWRNRFVRLHTL